MKVGQYFKRSVVAIGSNADIAEAARLMRTHHVGFLVVLGDGDLQKPVGVLSLAESKRLLRTVESDS